MVTVLWQKWYWTAGRMSEVSDSLMWLRTSLTTLQSWTSSCAKIGGSQLRTIFQCTKIEDCKSFSLRRRFVAKIENIFSPDHVFIRTKKSCKIMPITPLFWPKTFPGGSKKWSNILRAIFVKTFQTQKNRFNRIFFSFRRCKSLKCASEFPHYSDLCFFFFSNL